MEKQQFDELVDIIRKACEALCKNKHYFVYLEDAWVDAIPWGIWKGKILRAYIKYPNKQIYTISLDTQALEDPKHLGTSLTWPAQYPNKETFDKLSLKQQAIVMTAWYIYCEGTSSVGIVAKYPNGAMHPKKVYENQSL